jgi:hypothetical protein
MPMEDWIQHWMVARFLYDWQTLIAGVLAVLAALGTIWATIKSAEKLPQPASRPPSRRSKSRRPFNWNANTTRA